MRVLHRETECTAIKFICTNVGVKVCLRVGLCANVFYAMTGADRPVGDTQMGGGHMMCTIQDQ